MKVLTVLRSGPEYRPEHVIRLRDQVRAFLPDAEFLCLSDVDVPGVDIVPLKYRWHGWWSKMEMFRPDIAGDFLYMDLDTSIIGDMSDIAAIDDLTVLSDFYWPATGRIQSSLMFVPERERAAIWEAFTADPARHMRECMTRERHGDQGFLGGYWRGAQRWQDVLPGQIVSYKVNIRKRTRSDLEFGDGTVPENARLIVFHGRPRPWDAGY